MSSISSGFGVYTTEYQPVFSATVSTPLLNQLVLDGVDIAATRFFHSRLSVEIAPTTKYKTSVAVIRRYGARYAVK